jgi:hypothetical protein
MLALLTGAALAWESTVVPLHFADDNAVFQTLTFDTGYLPSQNDPISVRFSVTPTGGVATSFDAESTLFWPAGLTHHIEGVPGSGHLSVDATVTVLAEVWLNLIIWAGSVPLWEQELHLAGETAFDPPALGAAPVMVDVADPGLVPPFEFDVGVITGITLALEVAVVPALHSAITGSDLVTSSPDGDWVQLGDDEDVLAPVPAGRPDALALETTWSGLATNSLDLVLVPSASLDTWIGSFQLLSFDIPIPLIAAEEVRPLDSGGYAHPLPVLRTLLDTYDFGGLALGDLANLDLALLDDGLLAAEGTVRIEGDPAFSVWPESAFVAPGGLDGVVVTFEPTGAGEASADLVIASNDPVVPELRIPLTGSGLAPEPVEDPPSDAAPPALEAEAVSGCGCGHTDRVSAWPLVLLVWCLRSRARG